MLTALLAGKSQWTVVTRKLLIETGSLNEVMCVCVHGTDAV